MHLSIKDEGIPRSGYVYAACLAMVCILIIVIWFLRSGI